MRSIRPWAAALVLTLPLAACSSSSGGSGGSSGESSGAGDTRTVKDTMNGTVTGVPKHPKRVVALWRTGAEMIDLGVKPVGTLQNELNQNEMTPAQYAKTKGIPTVGTFESVDVEKVIKLKPDLIIGMDHGGLGIDYSELKDVAPTVILKIKEPPDVWANYPKVADLLGKKTDYQRKDRQADQQLADIKRRYAGRLKGVQSTFLTVEGPKMWASTSKALAYQRITAAGFGYNTDYTKNPKRYVTDLPKENIPDLSDQDVIFYSVGLDGTPTAETKALLNSASFKRLPAAKKGNVFPLVSGTIYTFAAVQAQIANLKKAAAEYTP